MKNKLWILLVLPFVFFSCNRFLEYRSEPASYQSALFSLKSELRADPKKRKVFLHMNFENKSDQKLLFQFAGSELQTKEGLSTLPSDGSQIPFEVDAKKSAEVDLEFYPINNRFYYQKIGFRGDLKREYFLPLDFIQTIDNHPLDTNRIRFSLSKKQYQNYLKRFGQEQQIRIYSFGPTNQMLKDLKLYYQTNGLEKLFEHHHHQGEKEEEHAEHRPISFFFSGDELIVGKFSFKMVAFTYEGKLKLYFKLINRIPNLLYLNLDRLKVKVKDREYSPLDSYQVVLDPLKRQLNPKNAELKKNEVYIGQNDRIEIFVEYRLPEIPDKFILDLTSLEDEGRDRILAIPLVFEKNKDQSD